MKEGICQSCGTNFKYYPSEQSGKFCKNTCRGETLIVGCANCDNPVKIRKSRYIRQKQRAYCKPDCSKAYFKKNPHLHPQWRGGGEKKICKQCGKSFPSRRATKDRPEGNRFCERPCYYEYIKKQYVKLICRHCSKEFFVSKNDLNKGSHKGLYCSWECRQEDIKNRVILKCLWCKKDYDCAFVEAPKSRFCSYSCKGKYLMGEVTKKRQIKIICKVCKKEFIRLPWKKNKGFCSSRCHGLWIVKHKKTSMTSIEKIVQDVLIKDNLKFIPQQAFLGKYLADFYLPDYKLILESDGFYWHNLPGVPERDKRRDEELIEAGYKVLRFKEMDLRKHGGELVKKELYKIIPQFAILK